jgi:hypothetical protein
MKTAIAKFVLGPFGAAILLLSFGVVQTVRLHWAHADVTTEQANAKVALEQLQTCRGDTGVCLVKLKQQNDAVQALADNCTERDNRTNNDVHKILVRPSRRYPAGAQAMNEWLATFEGAP